MAAEKQPVCYPKTGYTEEELPKQIACYPQFQVITYVCRHCGQYHLLFAK